MVGVEIDSKKSVEFNTIDLEKKKALEYFLYVEYPKRLLHINRCIYLGITPDEKRFDLEKEAYEKEQKYRLLMGKKPLDEIKSKKII